MKAISIEIAGLSKESKEKLINILEEVGCKVAAVCTGIPIEEKNHLIISIESGDIFCYNDSVFAKSGEDIELEIGVNEIKYFL